ncbi:hypothetical protein PT277_05415 [Acetobacteraceae bacterium ESL0709]|nr:hypothetical protein [Acetobacteraceae bacterium ESL0709]
MTFKNIFNSILLLLMIMDLIIFGFMSGIFFATWNIVVLFMAANMLGFGSFLAIFVKRVTII